MDFFAYFNGVTINSFGSPDAKAARRYINAVSTPKLVVIVPVDSTKAEFEAAKQLSISLASKSKKGN